MARYRRVPTLALLAVAVFVHFFRTRTEATFQNHFQVHGYERDHRIPQDESPTATPYESNHVRAFVEKAANEDHHHKRSFMSPHERNANEKRSFMNQHERTNDYKRSFMSPHERNNDQKRPFMSAQERNNEDKHSFMSPHERNDNDKRSFNGPHELNDNEKRSFMRPHERDNDEGSKENDGTSVEDEQQEEKERVDVSDRVNPLLELYSSFSARRFDALRDDRPDPFEQRKFDPEEILPELGNQERLIPIGSVFDRPLDASDTHHFYWRLLAEENHSSGHSPKYGATDREFKEERSPYEKEDHDFKGQMEVSGDMGVESPFPEEEEAAVPTPAGVRCEVHSRGKAAMPWLAVGFSDRGDLIGADLCVLWTDWKSQVHFQSAVVDAEGRLAVGSSAVCRGFRYRRQRGLLKFTFYRNLDTCLSGHYVIERGTTHLVWSYGSGPLYQLSGVAAAGEDSGSVMLELLKPSFDQDSQMEPFNQLSVLSDKVSVPAQETTYWCSVRKLPQHFSRKHHMVKYSSAIEESNADIVHHMELFHCQYPTHVAVPLYEGPCDAEDRPQEVDACKRVLAAWAMGATPFTYPQEAGLPIGGPDFNPYVMLEVHYNNLKLAAGRVDSSGMSLLYTATLRRHDASIMELGLEYSDKMAIPPRSQTFTLSGYCVPECTALGLPPDGIFIFGSQLHTHLTGVRTWTSRYRGGRQLPDLNRDNHYSTHFQEIRRLPKPVHVRPGDSLVMNCEYSTVDRENVTTGGFSISDEMCVNYVHYYPQVDLEVCKSSVDTQALNHYFDFMNRYELQDISPSEGWSGKYRSIEWTPLRADFLADLYASAPLSMQCNKSSGERFPGYWDEIAIPKVTHELPIVHRKCERTDDIENDNYRDT